MVALQGEGLRNTPAYAGKTVMSSMEMGGDMETPPLTRGRPWLSHRATVSFRKHPRLRGEDSDESHGQITMMETPPLTRGRLFVFVDRRLRRGNTPAYAGKTCHLRRHPWVTQKHPRLRGEDWSRFDRRKASAETPPLTRGRQSSSQKGARWNGKHPRLRGEDDAARYAAAKVLGNTPAYAGKTSLNTG